MKDDRTGQDVAGASLEARAEITAADRQHGRAVRLAAALAFDPLDAAGKRAACDELCDILAAYARAVDASRPGLTEEQVETLAKSFDAKAEAETALSRKNREEPAEWRHEAVSIAWDEAAALLRASRGETGPARTEITGIGGAPIRVRPTAAPDPRATLHDGDPQKSGGDEQ